MFLTAVLQAHTDSTTEPSSAADQTQTAPSSDAAALADRVETVLEVPSRDRIQPLPNAHRSRWV